MANPSHGARLSSGMRPEEAVRRAAEWWDRTGRHLIPQELNQERTKAKVRAGRGKAPAIIVKGDVIPVLHSGILNGKPWDRLEKWEKFQIVKVWHENFVLPEATGAEAEQAFAPDPKGGKTVIH